MRTSETNVENLLDAARELLAAADARGEVESGWLNGKLNDLREALKAFPAAAPYTAEVFGRDDEAMWSFLSEHEELDDAVAAASRYDRWRVTRDDAVVLDSNAHANRP